MSPLAKSKKGGPPDLAIILGHKAPMDDEEDEHGDDGDDGEEAKKDAMSALVDAMHGKDVDAALEAFDTLCKLHQEDYEEKGDEDEEDGE